MSRRIRQLGSFPDGTNLKVPGFAADCAFSVQSSNSALSSPAVPHNITDKKPSTATTTAMPEFFTL